MMTLQNVNRSLMMTMGILINFWRLWSYALGRKEGRSNKEANVVAGIRTLILLTYFVTNCFIVAGVIRHWNNTGTNVWICADKPNDAYWCSRR